MNKRGKYISTSDEEDEEEAGKQPANHWYELLRHIYVYVCMSGRMGKWSRLVVSNLARTGRINSTGLDLVQPTIATAIYY